MDNSELRHYGVKGMKWGIRRARKQLSKGDKAGGTFKLKSEREKASAKVGKLSQREAKLGAKYEKIRSKARKTYFTSIGEDLTERRLKKGRKVDRKLQKTIKKRVAMETGIREIDKELVSAGEEFVKKKVK